jgi:hypothetical protein
MGNAPAGRQQGTGSAHRTTPGEVLRTAVAICRRRCLPRHQPADARLVEITLAHDLRRDEGITAHE